MQVGVKDDKPLSSADFASDAAHFIYCDEGDTVLVDILATFVNGTDCDSCVHGERTWQWVVTGATSYVIDSEYYLPDRGTVTLALSEAGDEITVTAIVGEAVPGDCDDGPRGQGEHNTASHGGAQASCTIKLWRVDLTASADLDPQYGYPNYISEFASNVTITADPVGTSIFSADWTSLVDGSVQNEVEDGYRTWGGKFVAPTDILCWATVWNQCDLLYKNIAIPDLHVSPSIRRSGWTTEVQYAGQNVDWLGLDETAFPQVDWSDRVVNGRIVERPTYGRNANAREGYEMEFDSMVVPYYSNTQYYLSDYNSFSDKREEIASGPNLGLFYNTDNTMYEVKRQVLSNYWIKPSAGKPAVPANYNGNPYTNWLTVFEAVKGADCKCLNPGLHGGTGTGTFYQANLYHEGLGNPNSPNNRMLGHQSRLEDGYAADQRAQVDPVYRCDLLYDSTEAGLRAQNEGQRAAASATLSYHQATHHLIKSHPAEHSFKGDIHIFIPAQGWHDLLKDTF